METKYECNNQDYGIDHVPCGRKWSSEDWNKAVDTEYTRNEKCPKCGSVKITAK